jgi:hypothetical protein
MKKRIIIDGIDVDSKLLDDAVRREDLVCILLVFDPRAEATDWTAVSGPPIMVRKLQDTLRQIGRQQ